LLVEDPIKSRFFGGGGGIRTRVRRQSNESFYEHSPYFSIHPIQLLRAGFAGANPMVFSPTPGSCRGRARFYDTLSNPSGRNR